MRSRLMSLYAELDRKLRTRNWKEEWPGETPYEIAVGAILTQNTNWGNAEKAIANLKKAGVLEEKAMLGTRNAKLEMLIRPSGFYRQKAPRLKFMTRAWMKVKAMDARPGSSGRSPGETVAETSATGTGDAKLSGMRRLLLETHGIGEETADSILLYALGKPVFVIDAYTRRFCRKFLGKAWKNYGDYQKFFEANLRRDARLYKRYHALIVEWGKAKKGRKGRK